MHSVTIGHKGISASVQLFSGRGRLRRISARENTGTAGATFELWDGSDLTGQLLEPWSLAANESSEDHFDRGEHPITSGLYLNVQSGTIDLSVTLERVDTDDEYRIPVVVVEPVRLVREETD